MGDVDNWESLLLLGAKSIWKISVPSSERCCEPKTAPENSLFLKSQQETNIVFQYPAVLLLKNFLLF